MRATRIASVLVLLSLLPLSALTCHSQMMETAEYRGFLKRLDASAVEWRKQIESLKIEELDVNFQVGKALERSRTLALENLSYLHNAVENQLKLDQLSTEKYGRIKRLSEHTLLRTLTTCR